MKAWPGGGGKAHRAGGPRAGGRPTGPTNVRVTGRLLGWRRGDLRVLGGGPGGGDTTCYHLRAVRRPVRGRGGVHRACATPRSQALSELADFTKEKRSSSLPQPASRPWLSGRSFSLIQGRFHVRGYLTRSRLETAKCRKEGARGSRGGAKPGRAGGGD